MAGQLSLHITDACNSRCSFCVVGSPLAPHDSVRFDDLVRFLRDHADSGYGSVNLHGGEPTVHPRLFELLTLIRELGYPEVQIQTNGRRLAQFGFAERLAAQNVRLVVVSLHGADARVQDELAQVRGSFVEAVQGIREAKRARISVRTNTVLTRRNLAQLQGIVGLLLDLGVDAVNISNLHPVGSGFFAFDTLIPTVSETRKHLLPAVQRLLEHGAPVSLEGFPLCTITPHEALAVEREPRGIRMMYQGAVVDDYDKFMNEQCRSYGQQCNACGKRPLCGGVYKEYVEQRGWDEFRAFTSA